MTEEVIRSLMELSYSMGGVMMATLHMSGLEPEDSARRYLEVRDIFIKQELEKIVYLFKDVT